MQDCSNSIANAPELYCSLALSHRHVLSCLNIQMAQTLNTEGSASLTYSMPLLITWRHMEPRHQQPWYWPNLPRIFRFQHQNIGAWTKLPHFLRRHFEWSFLIKIVAFYSNFTKFVSEWPIKNEWLLIQVMAWCRCGDKPFPGLMLSENSGITNISVPGQNDWNHVGDISHFF